MLLPEQNPGYDLGRYLGFAEAHTASRWQSFAKLRHSHDHPRPPSLFVLLVHCDLLRDLLFPLLLLQKRTRRFPLQLVLHRCSRLIRLINKIHCI